ncbi:MAG: hypothetical protein WCJ30_11245, partial [Deltaproteobacteria bacterium]
MTDATASSTAPAAPRTPSWRDARPEPWVRITDNPLAVAFARRTLRPTNVWPYVVAIFAIAALFSWAALGGGAHDREFFYRMTLGLCDFPLVLVAPAVVASRVGHDRASGLLEFHRASPTTAWTNVL